MKMLALSFCGLAMVDRAARPLQHRGASCLLVYRYAVLPQPATAADIGRKRIPLHRFEGWFRSSFVFLYLLSFLQVYVALCPSWGEAGARSENNVPR